MVDLRVPAGGLEQTAGGRSLIRYASPHSRPSDRNLTQHEKKLKTFSPVSDFRPVTYQSPLT
ncbi:hypothetical protein LH612_29450, partial [Klebsiella pneumoniae]|nr:hypothetical protein [Klebsiella pneumoniae]